MGTGKIKYDVGELHTVEQENNRLKTEVGKLSNGRDILRDVRGITLSVENRTLQDILDTAKKLGIK